MTTVRINAFAAISAIGVVTLGILGATSASAQGYSSQFYLGGSVGTPGIYNYTSLSAVTPTITENGYTGTGLWNLLQTAGGIDPIPGVKNSVLRNYVVAVGSDGYASVFSGGEITPNFGGSLTAPTDMVAYQLSPSGEPLGASGFARMIVPGDAQSGRWVKNLTELYTGTAPIPVAPPGGWPGGYSSQFTLSGVQTPKTYTFSTLKDLATSNNQVTTLTATYETKGGSVTDTYTGITLWNLLNGAGLVLDPTIKNDVLRQYVEVVGTDGYAAIFSLGEIDPNFGGADDIVAYGDELGQVGDDPSTNFDGFARMVAPGDTAGGRYVSNIASIDVFTATYSVPEPSTWALLATSFLALAALQHHRRGSRLTRA
jgi:hypothetical protein